MDLSLASYRVLNLTRPDAVMALAASLCLYALVAWRRRRRRTITLTLR